MSHLIVCVSRQAVIWSDTAFLFYDSILRSDCILTYLFTQVGLVGYGLLCKAEQGECKVNRYVEL